jgi:GAF domain-containing protein
MTEDDLRAAVAAGVIGADNAYGSLLRSIVEVARAIFSAQRSSIFLLDEESDELVFEAVAGEEEQGLIGTRIPSSTGIAGWTLVTRQPLVIEDLEQDERHSREVAEKTGYVPKGIMSVPLLVEERALGVLQVLDRPQRPGFSLQEMELLGLFANQAAIALDLLQRSRRAKAALELGGGEVAVVARLAAALDELVEGDRDRALRLLEALEDVLKH